MAPVLQSLPFSVASIAVEMGSKVLISLALLFATLPAARAQAQECQEWEQCGGIGWTGATNCAPGLACTQLNPYYSQCLRSSTTSTSSAPSTSSTGTFKTWFSFGDSYTATGFNATGTQPSRGNPFGNPPYPGDTACGAVPNWIDYDATTYNTTFVEVFNYAYSGATIDNNLVPAYSPTIPSVSDQVTSFLNYQAPGKPDYNGWTSCSALFSTWIGINDIGNSYNLAGKGVPYNDQLLNRYFQLMQSLYVVGARHFLFLTVPPVYRTPLMLLSDATARNEEKTVIDDYNTKLSSRVTAFGLSNPDVTVQVYDTTPLFNTILDHPSAYGFQDSSSYGDGNTYAWCNIYHPSPPFHYQIAEQVAKLIAGIYI